MQRQTQDGNGHFVATVHSLSNLVVFRNSQGIQARGSLLKLSRTTLILEVYNPYSIVQLSEVLHDLEVRSGQRLIYQGRAVVTNLVNTGLMLIVSVRLIDNWSDLAGLFEDPTRVNQEVGAFIEEWTHSNRVRPRFQLAVSELRSFLTELNRWLEHVDVQMDEGHGFNREIVEALSEPVIPKLSAMFDDFEDAADEVEEEERTAHERYVQRDLHPLLLRAPFVHRAFNKPLGYAGDYEMVNMMLRDPFEGPTTYARIINALYLYAGPPTAHRNRIDILLEWLHTEFHKAEERGAMLQCLNVGCGPAVELQRLFRTDRAAERCSFELMDFNEQTLAYTRGVLDEACEEGGIHPDIALVHESVHHLLKTASKGDDGQRDSRYDIIYCAGLFDYLSDKICSRLLHLFYQWTKPGGRVLVTNVHPSHSSLHAMEYILEWHLIYRDESRMCGLVPDEWPREAYRDPTGINIFMELQKPQQNDG